MKLVKLSLVAALAAGAFSVANATPLDEAIKDVDLSGALRYRYQSGNVDAVKSYGVADGRGIGAKQDHNWVAQLNFNAAIADNFKAFIQLNYNASDSGYRTNVSNTNTALNVRQYYLTYTNEDVATSVLFGKQQLNTIWTDNGLYGLVGTGVKVLNQSVDGLTLAAFAIDSYNTDTEGDIVTSSANVGQYGLNNFNPYLHNIYGVAAIGSYDLGGGTLNPQLWISYLANTAVFYALDVAYKTEIFDGMNYALEGAYLGNSTTGDFNDIATVGNGNFFGLKGTIEANGFDASLGGVYYGNKAKFTITTLEDQGNIGHMLGGFEIGYSEGSNLNGDVGRNIFGYVQAGYTFNEVVRTGIDFVYGGTKTSGQLGQLGLFGGKKYEIVPNVSYKYSPKLTFSAWYSYLNVDGDNAGEGNKNTVRLQALYKF